MPIFIPHLFPAANLYPYLSNLGRQKLYIGGCGVTSSTVPSTVNLTPFDSAFPEVIPVRSPILPRRTFHSFSYYDPTSLGQSTPSSHSRASPICHGATQNPGQEIQPQGQLLQLSRSRSVRPTDIPGLLRERPEYRPRGPLRGPDDHRAIFACALAGDSQPPS